MKTKIFSVLLVTSLLSFAQSPQGYWDNQRATTKEIKLSAGDKVIIKSEEFPVGTTEFAYRITLLDENQKMVNDLASVLKAIPDPYFIGKGTGGAISLLSNISGSDKCTYALFVNEAIASDFIGSENTNKACLFQKNPVSKDAKVVSMKSTCLNEDTKYLWFAFKNQNWMMGEKIVLEIVPWVDNLASRGWTKKNKEILLPQILKTEVSKSLVDTQKQKYAYKLIESISKEYRFQDFTSLNATEQKSVIEKFEEPSLQAIGLPTKYNDYLCLKAKEIAGKGNYEEAISLLNDKVIGKPNAKALHLNTLAELYIESNQFGKALQTLQTAEKLDASELKVKLNLAHTYMFMNEISKAREIHKKYMNQNISAKQTWKNKAINDLDRLKKSNLPQDNIQKIWRLYN
ncbi:tetratricopeptide repeat protein [Flavobacterium sp. H122]|uniref:tetratricopeptide repeat protein n=1 Tax=Flavobacterium sp. H122 TaxID=2529860 RepID=UPI0010AAA760|nr:tetratricopeptide repeat protein [Flavobacterium sp. H122]